MIGSVLNLNPQWLIFRENNIFLKRGFFFFFLVLEKTNSIEESVRDDIDE